MLCDAVFSFRPQRAYRRRKRLTVRRRRLAKAGRWRSGNHVHATSDFAAGHAARSGRFAPSAALRRDVMFNAPD